VAVQDLRVPPLAIPRAPMRLPSTARLVNVVQFDASAGSAVVFTIDAMGTPLGALRQLWLAAAARGWQARATPPASSVPGAAVWARRGDRDMTIVAVPAGRQVRLIVLVARDGAGAGR
jgi:hypothetical protein